MKHALFLRITGFITLLVFSGCSAAPVYLGNISPLQSQVKPMQQTTRIGQAAQSRQQTQQTQAQLAESVTPYWTGDGGRGRSITILPPRGSGLTENQAYLPDLVANELVSNFSTFSAMTLFDRVNNQRQYDELLSGLYSDDDKAGWDLGHRTSTDFMLLGDITRTSTGYVLQFTVNRNSDKTTVASYSGTVSIAELDNMLGVRRASLDLLQKMGVQVTEQTRTELGKAATTDQVNALTAMAQGINAQRQGTEVAALTYFFQAAAFDASLVEAVSRTNVLSTNISTGNIGANVRNDIACRSDWVNKLTEAETFMNTMLRNTSPQRSIWYTTDIQEREDTRDYTRETTELRIEAALHTHAVFPVSVQKTVQAVYEGLQSTGRAQAWGLNSWPRNGITNANPFNNRWGGMIAIAFELLNEQGQVIGRQTVEMDSRFSFNGTQLGGPGTAFTTVRFTGVNARAISDRMNIRIASINGRTPQEAGISRIEPISARQLQANRNFTIYNGAIQPSSNSREFDPNAIPAELWGEVVTAIADRAFVRSGLTSVTIPACVTSIGESAFADNQLSSVTIPEGVTSIGASAFANNRLTRITIPEGVTTIGASAFAYNRLTSVTIPDGVTTIGDRAFADNHWTITDRKSDGSSVTNHYGLTRVVIPLSITSIGQEAFASHWTTNHYSQSYGSYTLNHWLVTELTIGANVRLGSNAIGNGFEAFYIKEGRKAGAYGTKLGSTYGESWERFDNAETMAKKYKKNKAGIIVLGSIVIGACLVLPMVLGIVREAKGLD